MVAPINPNKIQPATTERSTQTDEAKGRKTLAASSATSGPAAPATRVDGTLDIDQASTLYRQANTQSVGSSTIDSPESAMELASKIAQKIRDNGADALLAQAGARSNGMGALLQAAPA